MFPGIHLYCVFSLILLLLGTTSLMAFSPPVVRTTTTTRTPISSFAALDASQQQEEGISSRRDFFNRAIIRGTLTTASAAVLVAATSIGIRPSIARASSEEPTKVLVLGGSGFVGSQVVALLQQQGIEVVATSRDGRDGTVTFDAVTEPDLPQTIKTLASGCSAVISCIGAINTPDDELVNSVTGLVAPIAKEVGVQKFVYITVAPEVAEFAKDVDFLRDYMNGKKFSRDAVLQFFGDNAVFIEPTFIYGGGSFELNPPRVASFYGQLIEGLLASSPLRSLERIVSPGIVKIALEPPVPVEAVASAAVAGALGKTTPGVALDTYDKIKTAATLLAT